MLKIKIYEKNKHSNTSNVKLVFHFCLRLVFVGNNGRIEYSIITGDDNNDFLILSNGTIRTQRILDRDERSEYLKKYNKTIYNK